MTKNKIAFCRVISKIYYAKLELKPNKYIDLFALAQEMNQKYQVEYDERFNFSKVYIKGYPNGEVTIGITKNAKIWIYCSQEHTTKQMKNILNSFAKKAFFFVSKKPHTKHF